MRNALFGLALAGAAFAAPAAPAQAADAEAFLTEQCGTCHQLQPPADASLAVRAERKGPPLFYAGDKFRKEWLEEWLQKPTRIRPAGDFPLAHVKHTDKGDVIDESTLPAHPALSEEDAEMVAEALMAKTPNHALIEAEAFEPVRLSKRIGEMDFVKFKGCAACHRDTPKYGGVSGPELYTAWQRLQPAFITSYIRSSTAWEPRSLMPSLHLQTGAINKLASYLKLVGEKKGDAK